MHTSLPRPTANHPRSNTSQKWMEDLCNDACTKEVAVTFAAPRKDNQRRDLSLRVRHGYELVDVRLQGDLDPPISRTSLRIIVGADRIKLAVACGGQ